jgi:hypothetical protein
MVFGGVAMRRRVGLTLTALAALVFTAPVAQAEVEPGGWQSYSPGFSVQERGCGDVNNLTFRLTCTTASGDQRAERRYTTYTSGSRQFEGYFRITSMAGTRISLKQTFNEASGPFFMLAVERGGRLYAVHAVHDVGGTHRTYINGSLRHTVAGPSGPYYDKFGAYRTNSGAGQVTVEWSGIRFWRK